MLTIPQYAAQALEAGGFALVDPENADFHVADLNTKLDFMMAAKAAAWLNEVPAETANQAIYVYVDQTEGYRPGGGRESLFLACGNLDDTYLDRLALGFPDIVAAYRLFNRVYGGVELLRRRANGSL